MKLNVINLFQLFKWTKTSRFNEIHYFSCIIGKLSLFIAQFSKVTKSHLVSHSYLSWPTLHFQVSFQSSVRALIEVINGAFVTSAILFTAWSFSASNDSESNLWQQSRWCRLDQPKTSKSVGLIENKVNFCETGTITTQIKYIFSSQPPSGTMSITVEPPLSGHPPLSAHFPKSRFICQ